MSSMLGARYFSINKGLCLNFGFSSTLVISNSTSNYHIGFVVHKTRNIFTLL